jgi:hypothetical protein
LAKQTDFTSDENAGVQTGTSVSAEVTDRKKPFIEPAISVPVDVLEATTFFEATSSSVTN